MNLYNTLLAIKQKITIKNIPHFYYNKRLAFCNIIIMSIVIILHLFVYHSQYGIYVIVSIYYLSLLSYRHFSINWIKISIYFGIILSIITIIKYYIVSHKIIDIIISVSLSFIIYILICTSYDSLHLLGKYVIVYILYVNKYMISYNDIHIIIPCILLGSISYGVIIFFISHKNFDYNRRIIQSVLLDCIQYINNSKKTGIREYIKLYYSFSFELTQIKNPIYKKISKHIFNIIQQVIFIKILYICTKKIKRYQTFNYILNNLLEEIKNNIILLTNRIILKSDYSFNQKKIQELKYNLIEDHNNHYIYTLNNIIQILIINFKNINSLLKDYHLTYSAYGMKSNLNINKQIYNHIKNTISNIKNNKYFKEVRLKNAYRVAIIVLISMIIIYHDIRYGFWIGITALTIITPLSQKVFYRLLAYIVGTVFGLLISLLILEEFKSYHILLSIILICAISAIHIMVAYSTLFFSIATTFYTILQLNMFNVYSVHSSIIHRINYVILGLLLVGFSYLVILNQYKRYLLSSINNIELSYSQLYISDNTINHLIWYKNKHSKQKFFVQVQNIINEYINIINIGNEYINLQNNKKNILIHIKITIIELILFNTILIVDIKLKKYDYDLIDAKQIENIILESTDILSFINKNNDINLIYNKINNIYNKYCIDIIHNTDISDLYTQSYFYKIQLEYISYEFKSILSIYNKYLVK